MAGQTILGPDQWGVSGMVGMAIGGGLLVVPAGNVLTALGG